VRFAAKTLETLAVAVQRGRSGTIRWRFGLARTRGKRLRERCPSEAATSSNVWRNQYQNYRTGPTLDYDNLRALVKAKEDPVAAVLLHGAGGTMVAQGWCAAPLSEETPRRTAGISPRGAA